MLHRERVRSARTAKTADRSCLVSQCAVEHHGRFSKVMTIDSVESCTGKNKGYEELRGRRKISLKERDETLTDPFSSLNEKHPGGEYPRQKSVLEHRQRELFVAETLFILPYK